MNSASLRVQPKRGFFTASKRLSYAVLYIYFLQPRRGFPTPFPTACMRLELILQGEGEVPARAEGAGGLFHLLGLAFGERIGAYLLIDHRFTYHILCRKADGQARGLARGVSLSPLRGPRKIFDFWGALVGGVGGGPEVWFGS